MVCARSLLLVVVIAACGDQREPYQSRCELCDAPPGPPPCDPVAQTGCDAGLACAPAAEGPACVLAGTGASGDLCTEQSCSAGLACASICETVCDLANPACAPGFTCTRDSSLSAGVGVCEQECDPLTGSTNGIAACGSPDPANPTKACFGFAEGRWRCRPIDVPYYPCPAGYARVGAVNGTRCLPTCAPADTYVGHNTQRTGVAPFRCEDRGVTGQNTECIYSWFFQRAAGVAIEPSGNAVGVCLDDYTQYVHNGNTFQECATRSFEVGSQWGCVHLE